jgi:hypothetical protein
VIISKPQQQPRRCRAFSRSSRSSSSRRRHQQLPLSGAGLRLPRCRCRGRSSSAVVITNLTASGGRLRQIDIYYDWPRGQGPERHPRPALGRRPAAGRPVGQRHLLPVRRRVLPDVPLRRRPPAARLEGPRRRLSTWDARASTDSTTTSGPTSSSPATTRTPPPAAPSPGSPAVRLLLPSGTREL